ncbi:hypothetical protein [Brevundimonas sp.]|jgi:hypothetical protein|uniref:hypothetical protein n=1 Tax=Brevundimonas sp. TaxID=1871086 RepID=UPI002E11A74D|nr:hypothetical protein [Brevundimonas sp.]
MTRVLLAVIASVLAAAPVRSQEVSPPPPVRIGPAPAVDEAATARYLADFTRLCLDTAGERAAVRAAVSAAGWGEVPADAFQSDEAVDLAAWRAPGGDGATLLTSASRPGDVADGLIVRTCILQPAGGSAGPRSRLQATTTTAIGLPGTPSGGNVVWILSGDARAGFRDERAAFAAAGSAEAGMALGLDRPILMLTLVGADGDAGLALMRLSAE